MGEDFGEGGVAGDLVPGVCEVYEVDHSIY
jgi:hypothetical protein